MNSTKIFDCFQFALSSLKKYICILIENEKKKLQLLMVNFIHTFLDSNYTFRVVKMLTIYVLKLVLKLLSNLH